MTNMRLGQVFSTLSISPLLLQINKKWPQPIQLGSEIKARKIPKSGLNSWSSRWWDKSKDGGWKISDLRSGFFAPSQGLRQNQSVAADGIRKCLFPTTQRELFIHLWKCLWTNQRKLFRYGLRQEVTSCHLYDFFHIYHIWHTIGFVILYPLFGNDLVNFSFQTI